MLAFQFLKNGKCSCRGVCQRRHLPDPASSDANALVAMPSADKLVVAATIDDIGTLDPAAAYEFSTAELLYNVYETLLIEGGADGEDRFLSGLAESWEVSTDGMVHAFRIRTGVSFASGNPVTAADAAFSLRRLVKLGMARRLWTARAFCKI